MTFKKILLKALVLMLFTSFALIQVTEQVNAQEVPVDKQVLTVNINLNSPDAANQIKMAILEDVANQSSNFTLDSIYIDSSSIVLDTSIDTTTVHSQEVTAVINIKSKLTISSTITKSTIKRTVHVNIVDVTPPEIQLLSKSMVIAKNQEFNPWDLIEYVYDDSQIYPTVSVLSNNVDISQVGNYEITYSAVDGSNNRTTITVPVVISDKVYSVDIANAVNDGDDINYMLDLINQQRVNNGLQPYELGDASAQAAVALRAAEAATNVSHTRPDGTSYITAFDEFNVPYTTIPLEILTYSGNSVESKLNWWLNSSGHRSILLNPNYTHIALGYSGGMWCGIAY